jgi:hypothetical protein
MSRYKWYKSVRSKTLNIDKSAQISANWIRFLSINLLGCLFFSSHVGIKPAFAVDNITADTLKDEVATDSQAILIEDINQASSKTAVELNQPQIKPAAPETISQIDFSTSQIEFSPNEEKIFETGSQQPTIEIKQPQKIAQMDSSGTVGDTFDETNRLRQELLIEPIVTTSKRGIIGGAPASSAGTPTAYGASWRQAFIGGGLYFPFDGDVDGSLSVGFGLGDPIKSAGLEVAFNIISVGGQEANFGDFGESGTVGFKLHRYVTKDTAVAVGWSNAIKWGDADIPQETIYGVVTQKFDKLTVSLGLGSGAYRSKGGRSVGDNDPNFFGSLGYRFIPQASLISSWTGSAFNVGASFVPFKNTPLVINTIFTDVTDNLNSAGFSLTAGYSIQF